jgi:predicted DNA-binding protein (MmcQ/YjbR family)
MRAVLADVRALCAKLPAAEEYVMVHHPAFRVGKKPFVIVGMEEAAKGGTLSVNLGHEMQDQLLGDARFTKTPYIGQHGWVTLAHRALRKNELAPLVVGSYRRVAGKKQLAQLDEPKAGPSSAATKKKVTKKKAPRTRQ